MKSRNTGSLTVGLINVVMTKDLSALERQKFESGYRCVKKNQKWELFQSDARWPQRIQSGSISNIQFHGKKPPCPAGSIVWFSK